MSPTQITFRIPSFCLIFWSNLSVPGQEQIGNFTFRRIHFLLQKETRVHSPKFIATPYPPIAGGTWPLAVTSFFLTSFNLCSKISTFYTHTFTPWYKNVQQERTKLTLHDRKGWRSLITQIISEFSLILSLID